VCGEVDSVLKRTGTRRMIMGHTPNFEVSELLLGHKMAFNIHCRESCRVAMARSSSLIPVRTQIDIRIMCEANLRNKGISHAYGGALSALSMKYTLVPVPSSSSLKEWREKEIVRAVYLDRSVVLVDEERDVFGDI